MPDSIPYGSQVLDVQNINIQSLGIHGILGQGVVYATLIGPDRRNWTMPRSHLLVPIWFRSTENPPLPAS